MARQLCTQAAASSGPSAIPNPGSTLAMIAPLGSKPQSTTLWARGDLAGNSNTQMNCKMWNGEEAQTGLFCELQYAYTFLDPTPLQKYGHGGSVLTAVPVLIRLETGGSGGSQSAWRASSSEPAASAHRPPATSGPSPGRSRESAAVDAFSGIGTLARVHPLEKLQRALGHAIATRMRAREGKFIWQTGNGHVENFPRAAADQLLAEEYVIGTSTALIKRWSATTMPAVVQMARPLIETSDFYSAGATRALLTPSERVIRVVATLIPMLGMLNLKWWRGNLYYTFQYVLADEMGDLHSPKDENGIEIALSGALEVALRQQILADLNMMHNRGAPLGAGFLRQLGHISEALVLEAKLTKQNATPVTSCLSKLPGGG